MKSLFILGFGDGLGMSLASYSHDFDKIYALSRRHRDDGGSITNVTCDISKEIDVSMVAKDSISMLVYVASQWAPLSELSVSEFDSYFYNGPRGFLQTFNALRENHCLSKDCLVVGIGSTASEAATRFAYNSSAAMYSLSKQTQKSLIIQLSRSVPEYRFMNLTLGSVNDYDGIAGVSYGNAVETIFNSYRMTSGVRYSESILVSSLDIEFPN